MNMLTRRLSKVEASINKSGRSLAGLTDEQLETKLDEILARFGTSREEVINEYGSLAVYVGVLRNSIEAPDNSRR